MRFVFRRLPGSSDQGRRPNRAIFLLLIPIIVLAGWTLSGIVHEYGHALVILLLGGDLDHVQPFVFAGAPHVSYRAEFSAVEKALVNVAGVLASVLSGLVLLAVIPFRRLEVVLGLGLSLGVAPLLAQSLGFVVLPVLSWAGVSVSDDAIHFVRNSGIHPLAVSAGSFVVFAGCVCAFLKETGFVRSLKRLASDTGPPDASTDSSALGKPVSRVAVVTVVAAVVIFGLVALLVTQGPELSAGRVSLSCASLGGELAVAEISIDAKTRLPATIVFQVDISAESSDLEFIALSPDGRHVWKKTIKGEQIGVTEEKWTISVDEPGDWQVKALGRASDLKIRAEWSGAD